MDLFKGYIPTKNKQSKVKFKDGANLKTFNEVRNLSEYAGVLNNGIILVDIDNYEQSEKLLDLVDDLQLRCRVYETSRGKHFVFINTEVQKCATHTKLAIGLEADIKIGDKNSYEVLKFNDKEREILYDKLDDEEYQELPKWLIPVKSDIDFLNLAEGDGRNQIFFNYILTLQSAGFTKDEIKECITLINKYIVVKPLNKKELEVILRDDAFSKPSFYKNKEFLFDKFAQYLINNLDIVKINGQLHLYRDGIYVDGVNGVIESEMIKLIPGLNRQKRSEVMAYLEILVTDDTVIAPPNLIAFKNGILDINTGELQPFNPSIVITNKINWDYNSNAYSEVVDNMLNKLSCKDKSIRMLLEEVIGACFYRSSSLGGGKAIILMGDKSNGKSTFIYMIMNLLGEENISSLDLGEIGDRFRTEMMVNKLANLGDDISDEFIDGNRASVLKKVVTGDRIIVERKGCNPFEANLTATNIFSSNAMPRIKDKTGAVLRRLCLVPFDAKFSPNDADYDPYIKNKLKNHTAMEYLINIALIGLKRVLLNKAFTSSKKIEKELEEYEEMNNPILLFFKEIEVDEVLNETTKDVYRKYNEFCITNSFQPLSNIEFSRKISKFYNLKTKVKKIDGKTIRIFSDN